MSDTRPESSKCIDWYLFFEFDQDVRLVQFDERLSDSLRHAVDIRGMSPIRIMDRGESQPSFLVEKEKEMVISKRKQRISRKEIGHT